MALLRGGQRTLSWPKLRVFASIGLSSPELEQFDGAIREAGQEVIDENGRQEEPMLLNQRPQDGNGPGAPKPNGRDMASVMPQAPRAPAR